MSYWERLAEIEERELEKGHSHLHWLRILHHPQSYWHHMTIARRHNREVYRRGNMRWDNISPTGSRLSDLHILDDLK